MRMPVTVRTIFRKMLRDHPNVLDYIGKKSDVNNLRRDELIKLADELEINFLQYLSVRKIDDRARNFIMGVTEGNNLSQPFTGRIDFPLKTSAFGQKHTVNLMLEYEYTPEWQFYCPDQNRLKFRHSSLSMQLYAEAPINSEWIRVKGYSSKKVQWRPVPEVEGNLIKPIIIDDLMQDIEQQAWNLDQERRIAAGLLPGDRTKTKCFDKISTKKKSAAPFRAQEERLEQRINDLQNALDKALSENKAKSHLLAIISHEIRTPMASILGLTDMLWEENLSPLQRGSLEKLKGAAQGLISILNDILDFSKIQAGKLEFENIDFDLHALISETVALMLSSAKAKDVTLSLTIDPHLAKGFHSDPTRLRQILLNLLSNAIKFTPQGSVTVRVQTAVQRGEMLELKFEIIDTGIGIAEDRHDRLFELFTQSNASIARKYEGTGLGLAISKWLAESMGGEIGFDSIEGQGSTFWFTVIGKAAVSGIEEISPKLNVANSQAMRTLRILMAEDNNLNQLVMKAFLSKFHHTVVAVSDGWDVVQAARDGSYDLILMDMRMPKMNGIEATRAIRGELNRNAGIPIIAITADANVENHKQYFDSGINDCVTKPIDPQALLKAINRVLEEDVHVATNI